MKWKVNCYGWFIKLHLKTGKKYCSDNLTDRQTDVVHRCDSFNVPIRANFYANKIKSNTSYFFSLLIYLYSFFAILLV